jgi:predicted phage terminase large subunit-like protein
MQDVIVKEVNDTRLRNGRTIPMRGDNRRKGDKFARIESLLEPLHRNGQMYLNAEEKDNPHMQRLAEQFIAFAPGSRAHDDGPDAVEGAVWQIIIKCGGIADGVVTAARAPNNKRY